MAYPDCMPQAAGVGVERASAQAEGAYREAGQPKASAVAGPGCMVAPAEAEVEQAQPAGTDSRSPAAEAGAGEKIVALPDWDKAAEPHPEVGIYLPRETLEHRNRPSYQGQQLPWCFSSQKSCKCSGCRRRQV